jgi:hypothetical protein
MLKESASQHKKVEKVMHEAKHGELKSGSGKNVISHKQAVAIAMHEARIPTKGSKSRKGSYKQWPYSVPCEFTHSRESETR